MEVTYVNPAGRIIRESGGKAFEFADGAWGPLRAPLSAGDPFDEDTRVLTPEEAAIFSKPGAADK